jgi:hypothetical protein
MVPTVEDRTRLRALLDERVPAGGTDLDTNFPDPEVDAILIGADTMEEAAAEGWLRKAAKAFSMSAGLSQVTVGAERFTFYDPKDFAEFARKMSDQFIAESGTASTRVYAIRYPKVSGISSCPDELEDLY